MRDKKVLFVGTKTTIPIIRLYLDDGTECVAIIDSGSDVTVLDMAFVKAHRNLFEIVATPFRANYVGINSADQHPIVKAKGVYYYDSGKDCFTISAEMCNLSGAFSAFEAEHGIRPHMLIGGELLDSLKAKIDYENQALIVK